VAVLVPAGETRQRGDALPAGAAFARPAARARSGLTIIVPAYNEAESIADTVRSLQCQTLPPEEIVVVDDCSTDGTGEVARALGVTVMRPPQNTGTKAGAQNFALERTTTDLVMAIDADTTIAPDAVEKLLHALEDPEVVAACGFVLPRRVRSVWERGRYIEYLFAFTFFKSIQDYYEKPLIASGCFSVYRTGALRAAGGWSTRTMAEDMDLTWSFYARGGKVRFVPEAVSYPIEPHNLDFFGKQLRRWSHGFVQNVRVHWRNVLGIEFLRWSVAVAMWDAVFASIAYLIVFPLLALLVSPLLLLVYLVDAPVVLIPALVKGRERGELGRTLASLPSFFVVRIVNGYFMLRALWLELVVKRPLLVYEKGH
jgi:poly-beta-1,6-N-acetyl-D-glucosamine synthase